jgi:hypothetical protein
MTERGRFPQSVDFCLAPHFLVIQPSSKSFHVVSWDQEILQRLFYQPPLPPSVSVFQAGVVSSKATPECIAYDPSRFTQSAHGDLIAVGDRYGQIALLDRAGRLVCMFFAFRGQLSGWLPDGTCFGPASPTRAAASESVLRAFSSALRAAMDRGGRS